MRRRATKCNGISPNRRRGPSRTDHLPAESDTPCVNDTTPVPSLLPTLPTPIIRRMQTVLTVTVNGETRSLDGPVSISALLVSLGLDTRKVAVERNEEIVPRSRYAETWLTSGDALEIVHFIGGG